MIVIIFFMAIGAAMMLYDLIKGNKKKVNECTIVDRRTAAV